MNPSEMNPGDDSSIPPRIRQGKPVDVHRECLGCGYDIWGQDSEGVCSECGRAIRLTLAVPVSAWDEPDRARRMARGLRRMGVSMCVVLGALLLGIFLEIALQSRRLGMVSSVVNLCFFGAVLTALACFASGVWTAAQAGPSDRGYGRTSAVGLLILVVMLAMVVLDANNFVPIRIARQDTFGLVCGLVFGVQGILLGAWLISNSWIVSSSRRAVWMSRFGVFAVMFYSGLVFLLMLVSVGLGRHASRAAEISLGVASLMLVVTGGIWLILSPLVWLMMARRVNELVMLAPSKAAATGGAAAKDEPMTGATTH